MKRRKNGEGTIFFSKTHGLWVARITLPNGKRRAKTSKNQKVVKEWLLSQREALHEGIWVENDKVTLSEFIDRYLTNVTYHKVRLSTLQAYKRVTELNIKPELGNIRVIHLSPEKIQDFYSEKMKQGYSRAYVHNLHVIINSCLKHAQRLGLVNRNVAELVETPTRKSSTPKL